MTLAEALEKYPISKSTYYQRIRSGMTEVEALNSSAQEREVMTYPFTKWLWQRIQAVRKTAEPMGRQENSSHFSQYSLTVGDLRRNVALSICSNAANSLS